MVRPESAICCPCTPWCLLHQSVEFPLAIFTGQITAALMQATA